MNTHDQRADALVMFGLTGDLGRTKLFPALYEMAASGRLDIPVIGVGRSERSNDEIRQLFRDSVSDHEPPDGSPLDPSVVDVFDLTYIQGDSTEPAVYRELAARLPTAVCPVVYAALPPDIFASLGRRIAQSELPGSTRLVVEKPFGADARSARELWNEITASVPPEQLFIVDHFLAKASIENILTVRTANPLLHNSLDADHVAAIEIVMSEAGGVDGRGSFYESVGAIKDVVQNHLLQMLAMLTMESPASDSAEAFDAARLTLLEAVEPAAPADVTVGQYEGYRDLDDVAADSTVETFAALELSIANDRWLGTPISIRTGKRLAETRTEATFHLVDTAPAAGSLPNRVRFTIKPHASVALDLGVFDPDSHEPTPRTVRLCGPDAHGPLGDYALMFDDALNGDHRHFAQIDGIEAAWRILDAVVKSDLPVHVYPPGSNGPLR